LPASKAYLAANLAQWSAAAPTNATVAQNLAAYQNNIASTVDGRSINGTYKWLSNVFGEYSFSKTSVPGLTLGGGANFYGPRLIGNIAGSPFAYMYSQSYATATANAQYAMMLAHHPITLQLNVSNLFNYRRPIAYNVIPAAAGTGAPTGTFPGNYDYVQPITATLSIALRF